MQRSFRHIGMINNPSKGYCGSVCLDVRASKSGKRNDWLFATLPGGIGIMGTDDA